MPAFSHFFLKRLSARSKFSSSWIMTSDKFYFPPSWRLCAGVGQTVKPRRRRGMGQAKPLSSWLGRAVRTADRCRCVGGGPLRPHTRSGGAPNNAPSLRSVAGLLGRSLDAACEDTLTSLHRSTTARASKGIRARTLSLGDAELRSARCRALVRDQARRRSHDLATFSMGSRRRSS